jgi:1-acyl-sn-glycerol-3-phosphate acyltransferase
MPRRGIGSRGSTAMLRPTPAQLATLSPAERRWFRFADTINREPALKRAANGFLRVVAKNWVHRSTANLTHFYGLEHLRALNPDRGVFVIANHRSFFDFYTISALLLRELPWIERMFFPVRSTFFYDSAVGSAVNGLMSAWAMYPPVMRDGPKREFNNYAVEFVEECLAQRGTVVGFHPEGTRGKGSDPYELLPANIGAGTIVYRARPIVVPVFTLGLINNFPRQVLSNFDRTGAPVTMVFGPPMDLEMYYAMPAKLRTYKALSVAMRDELLRLSVLEREHRRRDGLPDLSVPPAP